MPTPLLLRDMAQALPEAQNVRIGWKHCAGQAGLIAYPSDLTPYPSKDSARISTMSLASLLLFSLASPPESSLRSTVLRIRQNSLYKVPHEF